MISFDHAMSKLYIEIDALQREGRMNGDNYNRDYASRIETLENSNRLLVARVLKLEKAMLDIVEHESVPQYAK